MVSSCFGAAQCHRDPIWVDHDPFDMLADEFVVRNVIAGLSCLRIGLPRLFNCPADEGFDIGFGLAALQEQLWLILGDSVNQAADLASGATSISSWNLTPWMTFGNWF